MRLSIGFIFFFYFFPIFAADEAPPVYILNRDKTLIYSAPNAQGQKKTARKGLRVQGTGQEKNGFLAIRTKGGKTFWVRALDVKVEVQDEISDRNVASDEGAGDADFDRFTFDLGASVGNYNHVNYTEVNLGLNYYFLRWLAWRNALFARFASGIDTLYGLDTSVRAIYATGASTLGLTAFAGPGYRFVNEGENVPFVEGGVIFKLAGFSLGGGVKMFFNEMVRSSATENDTQFFIILSGAGSL